MSRIAWQDSMLEHLHQQRSIVSAMDGASNSKSRVQDASAQPVQVGVLEFLTCPHTLHFNAYVVCTILSSVHHSITTGATNRHSSLGGVGMPFLFLPVERQKGMILCQTINPTRHACSACSQCCMAAWLQTWLCATQAELAGDIADAQDKEASQKTARAAVLAAWEGQLAYLHTVMQNTFATLSCIHHMSLSLSKWSFIHC